MNSVTQILLAIAALSILIAWHEFGHYLLARLLGMRVLRFSIGFGPQIIGVKKSDIEYQVGLLPVGGFVQIAGMSTLEEGASEDPKAFINRPRWAQFLVIAAGPVFNYALAVVLFFSVFWFWSTGNTPSLLINQVAPDSPAAAVGLRDGDVIMKMEGQALTGTQDFLSRIASSEGRPIHMTIEREKNTFEVAVTPHLVDGNYRMGVGYVPLSFSTTSAIRESFYQVWNQSTGILTQLGNALFGRGSAQLGGVVEITRQLSHAAERGLKNFLWILASLSTVLGLFNILPIPALDGSKLLMIVIESVVRRPIPAKAQVWIHGVGIVFILGLMLLLTVVDVMRIYAAN